jgi:hypothetical protein
VSDGFYFSEATGDARAVLAVQAATDWLAFLEARAADLASGGRLVVQTVGTDPAITPPGSGVTARKLMLAMSAVADEFVADGLLDRDRAERYVLPVYARTPAEARAPLDAISCPPTQPPAKTTHCLTSTLRGLPSGSPPTPSATGSRMGP